MIAKYSRQNFEGVYRIMDSLREARFEPESKNIINMRVQLEVKSLTDQERTDLIGIVQARMI